MRKNSYFYYRGRDLIYSGGISMLSHAFHDLINKGLFIVSDCDIFFVPDEEVDRVGYNPVQHGVLPVSPVELRQLLAHDRDGWVRSNLKRLGF